MAKGRHIQEERLKLENENLRLKESSFTEQLNEQEFMLYFFMFSELWRRLASLNKGAVVPYNSESANKSVEAKEWHRLSINCHQLKDQSVPMITAKCHYPKSTRTSGTQTDSEVLFEEPQQESVVISHRGVFFTKEKPSLSRSSSNDDMLSVLRTDVSKLKTEKQSLSLQLVDSHDKIKELGNKLNRLRNEYSLVVERQSSKQEEMREHFHDQMEQLRQNAEANEQKFNALLQQFSLIQQELLCYLNNEESSPTIATTKDLLTAVKEMGTTNQLLKQNLKEHEKKVNIFVHFTFFILLNCFFFI